MNLVYQLLVGEKDGRFVVHMTAFIVVSYACTYVTQIVFCSCLEELHDKVAIIYVCI